MTGSSTAAGLLGEVTRPARRHDPYPLWARLRENRVSVLDDGSYALGRYADVVALLHDPRLSSDPHSATDPGAVQAAEDTSFIRRDPPEHDRLRAAVTRYFGPPASPRVVAGLEPVIGGLVDDLLDALPPAGEADLVGQFAYPLPVSVITGLLGVPSADEPRFRAWTDAIVAGLDAQLVGGARNCSGGATRAWRRSLATWLTWRASTVPSRMARCCRTWPTITTPARCQRPSSARRASFSWSRGTRPR